MSTPTQEQLDRDVYEANKDMWYNVLCRYTQAVRDGNEKDINDYREILVDNYNNRCDGMVAMLAKVRGLERNSNEPI